MFQGCLSLWFQLLLLNCLLYHELVDFLFVEHVVLEAFLILYYQMELNQECLICSEVMVLFMFTNASHSSMFIFLFAVAVDVLSSNM